MDWEDFKERIFSLSFWAIIFLVGIFIAAAVFLAFGNPANTESVLNPDYRQTHPNIQNPVLPENSNTQNSSETAGSNSPNNPQTDSSNAANNENSGADNSSAENPSAKPAIIPKACGNGTCESPESCTTCEEDCGNCNPTNCFFNGGSCRNSCHPNESVYAEAQDCLDQICCVLGLV